MAAETAKANTGTAVRDQIREVANAPGEEVSDVCQALELVRQGQDINYQGASGTIEFDEQGDVSNNLFDVWTINAEGEVEVTSTIDLSES